MFSHLGCESPGCRDWFCRGFYYGRFPVHRGFCLRWVSHRMSNNEDNPLTVSLTDPLRSFEAVKPSIFDEFGPRGFDTGGVAPKHQGYPRSGATAFVSAVSLGQHGTDEEGEHYAGVNGSGSLRRHEKNQHAAWHRQGAVYVDVADIGNQLLCEPAQFGVLQVIEVGRYPEFR